MTASKVLKTYHGDLSKFMWLMHAVAEKNRWGIGTVVDQGPNSLDQPGGNTGCVGD